MDLKYKDNNINIKEINKISFSYYYYEGHIKNYTFNGYGKLINTKTGDLYQGYFIDGLPNGKGKEETILNIYEGDFKDGKYHGIGNLIFKNELEYKGEFKNGEYYGFGNIDFENGDHYTGNFENSEYNGKGILNFKNGDYYHGNFKDGKYHGEGILKQGEFYFKGNFYNGDIMI